MILKGPRVAKISDLAGRKLEYSDERDSDCVYGDFYLPGKVSCERTAMVGLEGME